MKKLALAATLIAASFTTQAATKAELQREFMNGNPVCQGQYGGIRYQSDEVLQCVINKTDGSRMIQMSLNQYGNDYVEVVITLDQTNGLYASNQPQYLVQAVKRSLKMFGKSESNAYRFANLPYSENGNKATVLSGMDFYIPDFNSASMYGNYMLTITKHK